MAPEKLMGLPYTYKADIYSFGLVIYFMLFRELPFYAINREDLYKKMNWTELTFKIKKLGVLSKAMIGLLVSML